MMAVSNLSIATDSTPVGDATARINEILANAAEGDASASKIAKRIEILLSRASAAFEVVIEPTSAPLTLRLSLRPTRELLVAISAGVRK